jgi:hypothetical protein
MENVWLTIAIVSAVYIGAGTVLWGYDEVKEWMLVPVIAAAMFAWRRFFRKKMEQYDNKS